MKITQAAALNALRDAVDAYNANAVKGHVEFHGVKINAVPIVYTDAYYYTYKNDNGEWLDLTPDGGGQRAAAKNLVELAVAERE